ncbi:hypothetical protein POTOM_042014 [Populus tomentosa]|uniref:P-loop containing nucleoside triphosphate hydrolases superfamily protein n=1 Tax=Populus tomentosa TaxID=118781 RepID=A0A8X7YNM0_POPTO|nr:hypothetical protein POTOM_042014 [Populus tomentosa]
MFIWAPYEVRLYLASIHRIISFFYPYIKISIHEHTGDRLERSEAYSAVEAYLSINPSKCAKRRDSKRLQQLGPCILSKREGIEGCRFISDVSHGACKGRGDYRRSGDFQQEQAFLCQNWKDVEARVSSLWSTGTGKSTMIAAMANLLKYDVYDLELTAVKDDTELRKLLIERTKKEEKSPDECKETTEKDIRKEHKEESSSKVTLSGLLNFIDELWSACGGERLIAFEVLSRNYLRHEAHPLIDKIESLMKETKIIPADVAESPMPKSPSDDAEKCLPRLIQALEEAKEAAEATENNEKEASAKKCSSSYQGSRGPCHGRCCPTTRK